MGRKHNPAECKVGKDRCIDCQLVIGYHPPLKRKGGEQDAQKRSQRDA